MTLSLAPVISFHLCPGSPESGHIEWHGVQWDWKGEEDLLVLALGLVRGPSVPPTLYTVLQI